MTKLGLSYGSIALCTLVACSDGEAATRPADLDTLDGGKPSIDGGKVVTGKSDGGARDGGNKAVSGPLPCDIAQIVATKCGACHGEVPASAPMSLVTADDFHTLSSDKREMYASVKDKINAADPRRRMPPVSNDALTADELAKLNAWLDKGAPSGTDKCTTTPPADGSGPYVAPDDPNLTCYKFLAHNGDGKTPLALGIALDTYYAYVFSAPWKNTEYGVVVRSVIDNKKALHHWLLFQDNVPGIPTGAVPQIGAHPTGQLLAVWAPGGTPLDLRGVAMDEGGVGLELPATTTYTVEFHYNSDDPSAVDQSGVEVCTLKDKPKNIAAYSWLGYDNVGVPSIQWQGTCVPWTVEPIHIISFMPHMHYNGLHMKGTINRGGLVPEVVHDAPFDFNYQKSYPVDLVLNPGDSLTTVCDYSLPSVFGQPTSLEMCYLFTLAYPKGALASPDAWGTIAHGSSSCLGQ